MKLYRVLIYKQCLLPRQKKLKIFNQGIIYRRQTGVNSLKIPFTLKFLLHQLPDLWRGSKSIAFFLYPVEQCTIMTSIQTNFESEFPCAANSHCQLFSSFQYEIIRKYITWKTVYNFKRLPKNSKLKELSETNKQRISEAKKRTWRRASKQRSIWWNTKDICWQSLRTML